MNDDDRLSRYLSDRADGITLPTGDPTAAMRRGSRRRTRRRGALVGGIAVVGLLATTVVVRRGDGDQKVELGAPTATASTYSWSVVKPGAGLAYSGSEAQLASGAVYGLSTAPGPATEASVSRPPTLYRSDDGTEWVKADLPAGLSATALSASGDTLYALGTAPAGGDTRDLVVASSPDGATSWTSITLPREAADLEARHPGQISLSAPTLAAKDATHQVATVVVYAKLDPTKLKPELADKNYTWEWTDTGLTVYQAPEPCTIDAPASTVAASTNEPVTTTTAAAATDPATADAKAAENRAMDLQAKGCRTESEAAVPRDANGNGPVVATYTFGDLGVDQELAGLVDGRTYAYATDDGAHFEPVDLPAGGDGWGSQIVAGTDGYTLFLGASGAKDPTTQVLRSTDGRTWDAVTSFAGSPMSAGLLSGRPAVAVSGNDGRTSVQAQQPDGSWLPVDLALAVPAAAGDKVWVGDVAFGPLGLAGTVSAYSEDDKGTTGTWVVHSTDGRSLSVLSIEDEVTGATQPIGITVTADAIDVRLSDASGARSPGTVPTQTVLVGTPPG